MEQKDQTNQTARIIDLWNGSWIAALTVGALVGAGAMAAKKLGQSKGEGKGENDKEAK